MSCSVNLWLSLIRLGSLGAWVISFVVNYNDTKGLLHSVSITMGQRESIQYLEILLKQVATSSPAPVPQLLKVDLSRAIVPSAYLVLSQPVGAPQSSVRDTLCSENTICVDLSLGAPFQSVNTIQNDDLTE